MNSDKGTYFLSPLFMYAGVLGTLRPCRPAHCDVLELPEVTASKGFEGPLRRWRSGSTRIHLGIFSVLTMVIRLTNRSGRLERKLLLASEQ